MEIFENQLRTEEEEYTFFEGVVRSKFYNVNVITTKFLESLPFSHPLNTVSKPTLFIAVDCVLEALTQKNT